MLTKTKISIFMAFSFNIFNLDTVFHKDVYSKVYNRHRIVLPLIPPTPGFYLYQLPPLASYPPI